MTKRIPLILMFLVLGAPFAVSLALLDNKDTISDTARGQWLADTHYIPKLTNRNWQLLWQDQSCQQDCDALLNLLQRTRMALGKRQEKLSITALPSEVEINMQNKLFIADQQGLVLLAYEATDGGAYKLLKDLKVLMKHGG